GGNSIDYQLGITDVVTVGFAARGALFPGGELYGMFGIKSEIADSALTAGLLVDPVGYDKRGDRSSFGPWVSPTASFAASKKIGEFRPFGGLYADFWKGSFEAGSEWNFGKANFWLGASWSYYYNDYGPV